MEMIPLTKKKKSYCKQTLYHLCKKEFEDDDDEDDDDKHYLKVRDHCFCTCKYTSTAHNLHNLSWKTTKGIPLVSHNGSNYDYHLFFFYLGFLSRPFTNHRTAGEGGGHFFNSSLPLPPTSQTLRH